MSILVQAFESMWNNMDSDDRAAAKRIMMRGTDYEGVGFVDLKHLAGDVRQGVECDNEYGLWSYVVTGKHPLCSGKPEKMGHLTGNFAKKLRDDGVLIAEDGSEVPKGVVVCGMKHSTWICVVKYDPAVSVESGVWDGKSKFRLLPRGVATSFTNKGDGYARVGELIEA